MQTPHKTFVYCIFLLCRQRPALGECLAHLAAAMPVAFLEPELNEFNTFSVYTTKTPRERTSTFICFVFLLSITFPLLLIIKLLECCY